ncbi:MAG TPA: hypothetical protein VM785_09435, partial [Gaiellales bacterium]|nr:hypothetical protein [Gaiellales bacterium]
QARELRNWIDQHTGPNAPRYSGLMNNCTHFACQVAGEAGRIIKRDNGNLQDARLLKNLWRRARNWFGFIGPWSLHRYFAKLRNNPVPGSSITAEVF